MTNFLISPCDSSRRLVVPRGSFGPLNSRLAFFRPRYRRILHLSRRPQPPFSIPKPRTERKRLSISTSVCIIEYRVLTCRHLSRLSDYSRRRPPPATSSSIGPHLSAAQDRGPDRHYSIATPGMAPLSGSRRRRGTHRWVTLTRCASGRRPS